MKEQILAVQRMQDHIEAHLEENITLADLARVSLYSPWYSYRLFRDYTGLTRRTTSAVCGCPGQPCG